MGLLPLQSDRSTQGGMGYKSYRPLLGSQLQRHQGYTKGVIILSWLNTCGFEKIILKDTLLWVYGVWFRAAFKTRFCYNMNPVHVCVQTTLASLSHSIKEVDNF